MVCALCSDSNVIKEMPFPVRLQEVIVIHSSSNVLHNDPPSKILFSVMPLLEMAIAKIKV